MKKILILLLLWTLFSSAQNTLKEIPFKEAKRIYTAGSGLFIDTRGTKFYKQGTILGALNMPIARFMRMKRLLPGKKGTKLVIFCNGIQCSKSTKLAEKIAALGYSRVMVYRGGYPEWHEKGQEIMLAEKYCHAASSPKREAIIQGIKLYLGQDEGMIDPEWFAQQYTKGSLPKELILIDVRRKEAFEAGHLSGARSVPWDSDTGMLDITALPKDKPMLFYCNTGLLSSDAYDSLDRKTAKRVLFLKAKLACKQEKCEIIPN